MSFEFPDPQPNGTEQAVAISTSRGTMHSQARGKLVCLQLIEWLEYPDDSDWQVVAGADVPNPGVSTRKLSGDRGCIRQSVVVGSIPDGRYPAVGVS